MVNTIASLFAKLPQLAPATLFMTLVCDKMIAAGLRFRKLDVQDLIVAMGCLGEKEDNHKRADQAYEKICHRRRHQRVRSKTAVVW